MSNNPHADDCGFALYGPPALCTCRAAWRSSDGIAEIRAVAGHISDVDDHVTVHQAADEIERLRERCEAYKGQVEYGAAEIERLRAALADTRREGWLAARDAAAKVADVAEADANREADETKQHGHFIHAISAQAMAHSIAFDIRALQEPTDGK